MRDSALYFCHKEMLVLEDHTEKIACEQVLMLAAGCSRYNMTVEAGKTYRVRMINAGSLLFYTACFDRHNVTIIAADAYPVTPLPVTCVDINLGQRCGQTKIEMRRMQFIWIITFLPVFNAVEAYPLDPLPISCVDINLDRMYNEALLAGLTLNP